MRHLITTAVALAGAFPMAHGQFAARSTPPKTVSLVPASGTPAFLQGADDCNSPHTILPAGNSSGNPFTTGTTGTTGQNETICYAFGASSIDNDVWFDWTSTTSGNANVQTCGGTGVDTKIAAWPLSICPADGTSLACNDDACGLQSSITFSATASTSYTLQLGTFPGASGGSGTFGINVSAPPPCGQLDDGTTENTLGLTAGGEMGWLQTFDCIITGALPALETAYGSALFPGSVTNGNSSKVAIYEDPSGDGDPTTGMMLMSTATTVVVNGDTDILNNVPFLTTTVKTVSTPRTSWILASADQIAGEFPGPMDQTNPSPLAWVVGSTLGPGTLDVVNLNNNNVPPLNMSAIAFPAAWLLRLVIQPGSPTGTIVCLGDGSGALCGCGNEIPATSGGCANTVGVGAVLTATGNASVTADTMSLTADLVINNNGLFFQGNNTINGGVGTTFGDGIRCCGQSVVRIQVVNPPGTTSPATAQMTETATTNGPAGTINPGDKKCYQYWYRDPAGGGVCGNAFNLSNAVTITWSA